MADRDAVGGDVVFIKTEPVVTTNCRHFREPSYRCTIELVDGTTIMRCGFSVQHALANAVACYKTTAKLRK